LGSREHFSLDLEDDLSMFELPGCDVLVLAAAMTRLADCRANAAAAHRINVEAPVQIAESALRRGGFVIFLSTNQVFDGSRAGFRSDEAVHPCSVYGKLKAEAEKRLCSLGDQVAIVRLSKTIGPHLRLFQDWQESLVAVRQIEAFTDLVMAPVSIDKVAAGIEAIGMVRAGGVWHLGGRQDISYFEVACHLAGRLGLAQSLVRAASAAAKGIPAEERPPHTALAPGDVDEVIGFKISDALCELNIGLGFETWSPPSNNIVRSA
jgi:dTDP-4-dehydrorhamnose reductase